MPSITWMCSTPPADIHAQIMTFIEFFVVASMQSGCRSSPTLHQTYFCPSTREQYFTLIAPEYLLPLIFSLKMCAFAHWTYFLRCLGLTYGFFFAILSLSLKPYYLLLVVLELTEIPIVFISYLTASDEILLGMYVCRWCGHIQVIDGILNTKK